VSEYVPVSPSHPAFDRHAARLCACCGVLPAHVSAGDPGASGAVSGPPLGIDAKYSARVDLKEVSQKGPISPAGGLGVVVEGVRIDPATGEVLPEPGVYDPAAVRAERFALQSAARRILPDSRTAKCLWIRRKDKAEIEVWRSKDHGTAFFSGLQTCASVWACPVCAAKISERRRAELLKAIEQHKAAGGDVLLLTLTNPHYRSDRLADLLAGQAKAMSHFNGHKAARALWASIGCIGTVRAWEVTHGRLSAQDNGWHPHFHVLLFVPSGLSLGLLRVRFYELWANSCRLAGLPIPSDLRGVTLEDGSRAAAYASKWGLDHEMTKGHMKKAGKKPSETPFDLLRAYLDTGDKQAAALFREFAETFKGRRQLVWSKGLKRLFDLADVSDDEIAAAQDDRAVRLGAISLDQWRVIRKLGLRGNVLELAERGGWEAVEVLLSSIPASLAGVDTS
jgi:hypothetical protein